jgi:hypothetical protein
MMHIGAAYLNRWLITEPDSGRGYFVRETDRPGPGGGQFTLIHRGRGNVQPCWELDSVQRTLSCHHNDRLGLGVASRQ